MMRLGLSCREKLPEGSVKALCADLLRGGEMRVRGDAGEEVLSGAFGEKCNL